MTKVIETAGLSAAPPAGPTRRDLVREVRKVLRDPNAPEDAVDDALEALIELSKE